MNITAKDIYEEIKDKELVPPCDIKDMPVDPRLPEGAREIKIEDTLFDRISVFTDVVYAERDGVELHLQILMPWERNKDPNLKQPIIVFVPGSAWGKQNKFSRIAELMHIAQRGFVVASVEYRHSGIAKFPAQAEDCKTAIRYMKAHAEEYHGDPERVALWGDSSGGHTILIAGFSGNGAPDTELYGDVSCEVNCMIDWYGPTLLPLMSYYPSTMDHVRGDSPEGRVLDTEDVTKELERGAAASPMNYLSKERPTPPLLMMHGDRDGLVPFDQSVRLYELMREMGKEVEFIKVLGGGHGFGGFRSEAAVDIVEEFIRKHI